MGWLDDILSCSAGHLRSFGDALVASVAVNHDLISMKQLRSRREVVHIGSRVHHRMDQA